MNYGIIAIGSRGDVQPYIALALGLKKRGYSVTIMAHGNFRDFVVGYGIGFHALYGSVEELLRTEEGMAMLRSGSILAFARYLKRVVAKTQSQVNQDMLVGAADADVLICSVLAIPWVHTIAEKLDKRWAIVQLNLPSTRTARFPLAALDLFDFPQYNRFTYRLLEFFHWSNNRKPVNAFRRSLGLPPLQSPVLKKIVLEGILNLYCISPSLCEKPDDWPPDTAITGFLFIPSEERQRHLPDKAPDELSRWLDAGDPPIYIGFGSIPIPEPALFQEILRCLLTKTPYRFLFCQGWSEPLTLPEHPRFFSVASINHEWLFPRCRLAIIHGGIGTTAAVLKAGIPVIILSIIADQPWWGKIIEKKKLGIHFPFRMIAPGTRRGRAAIRHRLAAIAAGTQKMMLAMNITQEPEIKAAAQAIGEMISKENGLEKTIGFLENYFRSRE